ncbi:MFS transporter [Siccirubricoccus deserti]|uniref:MFS transporter n=1 Tax=Siccirubricoccus deserti TaxID=2013562 RepID=A0A9X0QV02_9PROT|nr:MFS transporter [Siccirubricoccus deserti]MBC4014360.1 MFS transporter [Siccirubricoccus deserti]GGC33430.1 MFS transporter [Siccirubricoccus deserti]
MPEPARRHAELVVGLAVAAIGLATTLPLPLYGMLAARGGYGTGALALAFACYAATLIVTAPLLGPLPDRIGRKPCVLLGVVLAAVSTLVLTLWPSIPALAVARVAQGLGMGCVTGAATAWAAELAGGGAAGGRRAAGIIAAATIGSFGAGGVLTLASVAIWPAWVPPPTFAAHLAFAALLLLLTARLPETLAAPRGPWLSRPAFPPGTLATTLAILPGWGATATVLTTVQAAMAAEGRPLLGPLAACGMMIIGLAAQQTGRKMPAGRAVRLGLGVLVVGGALTFWGVLGGGLLTLLAGAAMVGIGTYAFVYPGGLAAVAEAASGEDRARAVAGYFVVAHAGFSAVPLAVGLAVDAFGIAAALLGAWLALAGSAAVLARAVRR